MMGFGTDADEVAAFGASPSLLGDLGTSYLGSWVGDLVTLGAAVSAFGCCLACVVGGARLLFAMSRSATVVAGAMGLIILVCATAFGAHATDTFAWMGTIGTLILLVAYGLTTIGAIQLLFVHKRLPPQPGRS